MTPSRAALPALVLGAASIGLAPILVRFAKEEGVGPSATAFFRLALALPVLAAWMSMERRRSGAPRPGGRDAAVLLVTGLFFAADLAFWHASIGRTRVANATLLACLASTFAALAAWILFRERMSGLLLGGLVVALAGSFLLMSRSLTAGHGHLLGDAFGLLAALFYAGYLLGVGRLRGRFSTATVMTWTGIGALPGLFLTAILLREGFLPATSRGWLVLVALAFIGQIAGQTLIAFSLAHLSMAFSAVSLLVQPVVAALLSWWLFNETFAPVQYAGSALILIGIVAARLGTLPKG